MNSPARGSSLSRHATYHPHREAYSWREEKKNLTGLAAKRSGRNQSEGGGTGGGVGEDWHFSSGSAAA